MEPVSVQFSDVTQALFSDILRLNLCRLRVSSFHPCACERGVGFLYCGPKCAHCREPFHALEIMFIVTCISFIPFLIQLNAHERVRHWTLPTMIADYCR
jgi:hypothetical protein